MTEPSKEPRLWLPSASRVPSEGLGIALLLLLVVGLHTERTWVVITALSVPFFLGLVVCFGNKPYFYRKWKERARKRVLVAGSVWMFFWIGWVVAILMKANPALIGLEWIFSFAISAFATYLILINDKFF